MAAKKLDCKFYVAQNSSFTETLKDPKFQVHKLESFYVNNKKYYVFLYCSPQVKEVTAAKEEVGFTKTDLENLSKAHAAFISGGNKNYQISEQGMQYLRAQYPMPDYFKQAAELSKDPQNKGAEVVIVYSYEVLPYIYNFVMKSTKKTVKTPPRQLGPSTQVFALGIKMAPFLVVLD